MTKLIIKLNETILDEYNLDFLIEMLNPRPGEIWRVTLEKNQVIIAEWTTAKDKKEAEG